MFEPRTLPSGAVVEFADEEYVGGIELSVDGDPQSHVFPLKPQRLHYEYAVRMANVVRSVRSTSVGNAEPTGWELRRALHIGGGAGTFARYLGAEYGGIQQVIVDNEVGLGQYVQEFLPFHPRDLVEWRELGEEFVARDRSSYELIVVDAYRGTSAPPALWTPQFFADVSARLAPGGLLLVNLLLHSHADAAERIALVTNGFEGLVAEGLLLTGPTVVFETGEGNLLLAVMRSLHGDSPLSEDVAAKIRGGGPYPATTYVGPAINDWLLSKAT